MNLGRTRFETSLLTRPDDIDMNQHVHNSRYLDYVLAARYDQMARCYGFSMEDFTRAGFGWVVRTAHVEFKRPLIVEPILVRTWIEEITRTDVRVQFEIVKQTNGKLSSDGWFLYTMINLTTARAEPIPDRIAEKYAI
jgi:YbgC/YbaW family acyl-CoA thioester hydrolase